MRAALVVLGGVAVGCGKEPSGTPRAAGGHTGPPVDPVPGAAGTPTAGGPTGSPTPAGSGGALLPGATGLRYPAYYDATTLAGPVVDQSGRTLVAMGVRYGPQDVDVVRPQRS